VNQASVDRLKQQRPEWAPWLEVVHEILRETKERRWESAVPEEPPSHALDAPLLSEASLVVDPASIRRLLRRLVGVASRGGTPKMSTLEAAVQQDIDLGALFQAAISQDHQRVRPLAAASGADAEALEAVAALLPVPFLQACNARWASAIAGSWIAGYCPVCGSWPAFAEVRGIERSRHFRCGRCGGEWHAQLLRCAYCDNHDHDEFVSLVPEKAGAGAAIEACMRCRGYVKVFTRLQGCGAASVIIEDLESVDFDLAAIDEGYERPPGPGRHLNVTVHAPAPAAGSVRFFPWTR
jgi:FdhE protein